MLISAPESAPYNEANVSCAAANITIAATELAFGSCYVISPLPGLDVEVELDKKIGVSEGFALICGVLIGYSDGDAFSVKKSSTNNVNYCK
ncbi:hypothetical protein [Clostridium sp. BJN0013]|uniref:hypothetical protein n=1 Tax=Clostridium sp. BJN0013 TaxID=3236840 RepID=UPI0034C6384E